MEIIPQHNLFYEDDCAISYKSGEWPGIRPSKWRGSKLIMKPIKRGKEISTFERSLAGQRHFTAQYSSEMEYRPGRKLLPKISHEDQFKPLKRHIDPIFTEPPVHNRHYVTQIPVTKEEPFRGKKIVNLSRSEGDKEYNVEDIMIRKGRIHNLEEMRNKMPQYAPGDKIYKSVDYSPDFFKLEGLVVGSTIGVNYKKTTPKCDNFFDTLDLTKKTLNPEKFWTTKCKRENQKFDENYVSGLQNWEKVVLANEDQNKQQPNKK